MPSNPFAPRVTLSLLGALVWVASRDADRVRVVWRPYGPRYIPNPDAIDTELTSAIELLDGAFKDGSVTVSACGPIPGAPRQILTPLVCADLSISGTAAKKIPRVSKPARSW
jgi:hypothetical protein